MIPVLGSKRQAKAYLLFKEGKYIKIVIMDHGVGIARNYLSKNFDPHFIHGEDRRIRPRLGKRLFHNQASG